MDNQLEQSGEFAIKNNKISINDIFNKAADLYKPLISQNGNTFVCESEDIIIESDESVLLTIIRNLIDNANKHTSNGIIEAKWVQSNRQVEISIIDTGYGMKPEIREAFNVGMLDDINITGFGLRLVYELSKKIGAVVYIKNNVNTGSCVHIMISSIHDTR